MNNLNTVLVEGKLVRDPFVRDVTAGYSMCRMAIANNRYFIKGGKWEEDTSFFTVVVYGNVAELCRRYLRKGRGIRVVGRLKQYRDNSKDGPREQVYVIAEHIEFQPEKQVQPAVPSNADSLSRANDATFGGSIEDGVDKHGQPMQENVPEEIPEEVAKECSESNGCTVESSDAKEETEIREQTGEQEKTDEQAGSGPETFEMNGGSRCDAHEQVAAGGENMRF